MAPSGVTSIPFGPQPCWRDSSLTSQAVSELTVVTPIFLPLRSATDLTAPSGRTSSAKSRGAPAMAATALTGEPFWIADISGPEPSPISMESAASACCSRAPPAQRGGFDLDAVFAEQADPHADIERHEGERLRHRLADAQQLGRGAEGRRRGQEQRREQSANAACLFGMAASAAMVSSMGA